MTTVKPAQMEKALAAPSPDIRIFLLYGPDEAGSAAMARKLEQAMGEGAERIDLDGATLRGDPARLADEAASLSMFGDRRWIRLNGVGEESVAAIDALLTAPQAGNPVVAIAGAIKATSKLAKLCGDHPAALACINYAPDDRNAAQIVMGLARERGLRLTPDLARRIAENAANDRALMAGEVEKLALYCDATPDHPADATAEAVEALSAETIEGDPGPLVNAVFGGDIDMLHHELSMMAASGAALASVTRPLINRAMLIGEIHAEAERGGGLDRAIEAMGKRIFWKDKALVQRQARAWPLGSVARLMHHLLEVERATRDSRGPGDLAVRQALLTISRQAARARG